MAKTRTKKVTGSTDDPGQTYIEDTGPLRIAAIDKSVQALLTLESSLQAAKESVASERDILARLMAKNELQNYKTNGRLVIVVPGVDKVQIKKAKAQ